LRNGVIFNRVYTQNAFYNLDGVFVSLNHLTTTTSPQTFFYLIILFYFINQTSPKKNKKIKIKSIYLFIYIFRFSELKKRLIIFDYKTINYHFLTLSRFSKHLFLSFPITVSLRFLLSPGNFSVRRKTAFVFFRRYSASP
jgi:hypothetical protein